MNTLLRAVLVASVVLIAACGKGDKGDTGPQGPAGPAGTSSPSVSAITPVRVFSGRKVEVTLSGDATSWSSTTTVDFGTGITVDKLTVASPSSLVAEITVAPDAALGPRDVTVKDSGSEAFKGAFHVDAPIDFSLTNGTLSQGSVVFGSIKNLDLANPFDTTSSGGGLFSAATFTNLKLDFGTGLTANVSDVQLYSTAFTMFVDVTAPTSAATAKVTSGPPMGPVADQTISILPSAFTVAPRTGTSLVAATPVTVTTTAAYASTLYALPPAAALSLYDVSATSTDTNATPAMYVLPASGKWTDMVGNASSGTFTFLAQTGDTFSGVFLDTSGGMGTYSVGFNSTAVAQSGTETGTATTIATAQQVDALPFVMTGGNMTSDSYQHVLKFTVSAADANKKIHVGTFAGDSTADTVVEIKNGMMGNTSFALSTDMVYLDDVVSPATTAAGDYYVLVTPSTGGSFDPTHGHYNLYIKLE